MENLSVPNLSTLHALKHCEDGEIIHVQDLGQDYYYNAEIKEWIAYYPEEEIITSDSAETPGMDLYKINKMLINQFPDLDKENINKIKKIIRKYVDEDSGDNASAYMLLCHDLRYYTVFLKDKINEEKLEDIVVECIEYLGKIKDIDYDEDNNAIEIWFVSKGEPFVAYLFNYDKGVILCQ